ncbi:MAG: hypothetical protein ABIX01_17235 [Chitinophagaceae bacterium]
MFQIKVPKPCHEDWDAMTPTSRGAFCGACAKDVVDFTNMSDDEVKHYLLNRSGDKVCGKFNNTQLQRIRIQIPNTIFYSRISGWKKFIAVVMLAFGSMLFGCDVISEPPTTVGIIATATPQQKGQLMGDTTYPVTTKDTTLQTSCEVTKGEPVFVPDENTTMGMVAQPPVVERKKDTVVVKTRAEKPEPPIMGKIAYYPADTSPTVKNQKDALPKTTAPKDLANSWQDRFY